MQNDIDQTTARHIYNALKLELDYLRQRDNHILFALDNPPELDPARAAILERMRKVVGEMQALESYL